MKKKYFLPTILFFLLSSFIIKAQSVEFSYDITSLLTPPDGAGNAGVGFINNQFWVSEWRTGDIHLFDNKGAFVETFQIPGLTGTRSFTSDGVNLYCGTASTMIFKINPITRTLINTINITTTSNARARICSYDASLDNGSGGFWIASFFTDIASVDMSGNELSIITEAVHGLESMSGGAVDDLGNLYVYNRAGANDNQISIIDLSTGTQHGTVYDVFTNVSIPHGATTSKAAGLFISEDVVPGKKIVVGLSQFRPNILFGIDFETLGINDLTSSNITTKLYPNPSSDFIQISGLSEQINYKIFNVLGIQVRNGIITNTKQIDIRDFTNGLYFLKFSNGNTIKFIKE